MSRQSIGDYIKQYTVKVIYKKYNIREGSGFLVKINETTIYLFTVKHNFKVEDDDEHTDVDISELGNSLDFITVTKGDKNKILDIESLLFAVEELDLLVFRIRNLNFEMNENIPISCDFLQDSRFHEEKCCFYGYPQDKDGRAEINLIHTSTNKEKNSFILKRGLNIKNTNYFSGYSGSGVFIKKNNVYYIVGIVIKADDELDNFEVIELSKVIDKINKKLTEKSLKNIKVKRHIFDMHDISDMYETLIKRHPNNSLMRVLSRVYGDKHSYKDLIDTSDKLEKLNEYTNYTNDFDKLEYSYTQEIADIYLMSTFIASIYQDKEKAKEHFKKACKYRPHYNLFLTEIDRENSKEELLISAKVAYTDKEYDYSEQCFNKVLSLKCSYDEKNNIYNYLLKIAIEKKDKSKQFTFYHKILALTFDNFKKAEIFYKMSFLFDNKKDKTFCLVEGNKLIEDKDEFLELKYLIKKELYQLEETSEMYKELKFVLKRLVKLIPSYQRELTEMRYFELQNFIDKLVKSGKIIILLLFIWMIYLLF